jgi:hypothetical protein
LAEFHYRLLHDRDRWGHECGGAEIIEANQGDLAWDFYRTPL